MMVLDEVSLSKDRMDRVVRLNRSKLPPMDLMVLLVRLTRLPALWATKSPWISVGPLISMLPAASGLKAIDPEMLVHWASALASAVLVMVAVGPAQRVGWESWGPGRHMRVSTVSCPIAL
jgi:hypothetical protein